MTLKEAVKKGISRLRQPRWNPFAYVKIDLFGEDYGPWAHLFDVPIPGQKYPIDIGIWDLGGNDYGEWEEFVGELHEAEGEA